MTSPVSSDFFPTIAAAAAALPLGSVFMLGPLMTLLRDDLAHNHNSRTVRRWGYASLIASVIVAWLIPGVVLGWVLVSLWGEFYWAIGGVLVGYFVLGVLFTLGALVSISDATKGRSDA